ncbi:MAG: hypothetical protein M1812_006747 [Candelaria pacifica]|nr:MAG: hypothetical protein M1812_006747 [Candelaria pacifica]
MTPRKAKQRHNQASDYESDINYLTDNPIPPPARTNAELNLSALRRHNPAVASLLSIAPYAVVYIFSPTSQQWEKSGIEGTLFVCQLRPSDTGAERYTVMLLNRRGLENFEAELLKGADVEITEDYVILRANDGEHIYGLWIFSEPEPSSTANTRAINAQIIQDCALRAEASTRSVMQNSQQENIKPDCNAEDTEEDGAGGVPMGRQLSLRELFGQQREQDSGWSVKNHSPQPRKGQFTPSVDTQFFRSTNRPSQQNVQQANQVGAASQGPDLLGELFRKAGEGYLRGA